MTSTYANKSALPAAKRRLRAAIYLRISQDKTGEREAIERQDEACRATAKNFDFDVVAVFVDHDRSAFRANRKRPDYDKLVALIEAGGVDVVIALRDDRLHRDADEGNAFIKLCQRKRVELVYVHQGAVDLSSVDGEFTARLSGLLSWRESKVKGLRHVDKNRDAATKGRPAGGPRPFGYRRAGRGVLVVDENEAAELARLADALVAGQSLRFLTQELNERGVTTTTGRKWRTNTVLRLMTNPRLAGLRTYKGEIIGDGSWPPIFDAETHEAIKAAVAARRGECGSLNNRARWGRIPTSLGTGLYLCGVCAAPRIRLMADRGLRYRCSNGMNGVGRSHVTRAAGHVDALVEATLLAVLSTPGFVKQMCKVVESDAAELARLRVEQDAIPGALEELDEERDAGDINRDQYRRRSRRLNERDEQITAILAKAATRSPLSVLLGAQSVEQMWRHPERTIGQKRAILAEVLTVTILPNRGGGPKFDPSKIDIALTEQARWAIERCAALHGEGTLSVTVVPIYGPPTR